MPRESILPRFNDEVEKYYIEDTETYINDCENKLEKTPSGTVSSLGTSDSFVSTATKLATAAIKEMNIERGGSLDFSDDRLKELWWSEVIPRNIRFGAKVILAENVILAGQTLMNIVRFAERGYDGSNPVLFVPYLITYILETPLLLQCLRHPSYMLYLSVLVFDGVMAFLCSDPEMLGYEGDAQTPYETLFFKMIYILLTIVYVPEYRLIHFFLWSQTVAYGIWLCATSYREMTLPWYHHTLDIVVGLAMLSLFNIIATRQKLRMEVWQQSQFQLELKQRIVCAKMFRILEFMVPPFFVMPMLKSPGTVIAEHLNRASILFIVFDDFSQLARKASPSQLFSFLNRSFTKFDKICAAQEVTKVETVGEEYVCGVGISPEDRHKDDILGHKDILGRLLRAAYEIHMLQYLPQRDSMMLKMGIHTGPVVAGVVGQKLPRFRLFGDTMNTAARMMQMGSCHEVQFGESTAKELPEWASARPRGYVEMKGKGEMMTYVLDWSSVEKQFSYRSNAEDSVKVLQGQITPFEVRTPSTPGKATLVDSLFEFVHGKPHNEVQELETKSGILEVAKTVSFTDALAGKSWLRKHCNPFALWLEFSIQEETAFTRWFTEERTMKGFARSLRWQLTFFTGLSLSVAIYAIYRMEGFAGTTDCLHSLSLLWPFLACRLFTFLPICCWRIALRLNNSRQSQLCLAFIRSIIGVCIILSYELLPVGLSKGRYASHYGGPSDQDNQPSGFGLHDVASNIIPFVLFAEYSYSISSVQLLFIPTLLSKVLSISLLGPLGFLVFQKGTLLGYLIVASAFSIFRIYFLEESLRRKFKALCMVDLTYQRIHSILATLMPPMVVEDLRLSVTRQSHHYKKATVVQSDLCGFTKLASTRQPSEVVEFIGQLFGLFDDLTEEYDIYKVETVGDAYIAAMAEEPLTSKNKPLSVVLFGLRMIQAAACWSARRGEQIGCRVGVHSGSCLGGIVGTSMQRYHLFGELMTSLEVLESTAPEGRVQLSQACRHCLEVDLTNEGLRSDEFFLFEKRTESLLTTSKGATHEFSEVGGATYLVSPTPQGSSQFGLVSRSASSTFI